MPHDTTVPAAHTFIYALVDPRNGTVRYVGKANNPATRLYGHLKNEGTNPRKKKWLAEVLASGIRPLVLILEQCPRSEWQERESQWIRFLKSNGCDLVNLTDGGECGPLRSGPLSAEHRAKIGAANRGRRLSAEAVEKMAASKRGVKQDPSVVARRAAPIRGRPRSEATKAKIRAKTQGREVPPERRRRIAESLKGRSPSAAARAGASAANMGKPKSEETKARMSAAHHGKPLSDSHREALREAWTRRQPPPVCRPCPICGVEVSRAPAEAARSKSGLLFCCRDHSIQYWRTRRAPRVPG